MNGFVLQRAIPGEQKSAQRRCDQDRDAKEEPGQQDKPAVGGNRDAYRGDIEAPATRSRRHAWQGRTRVMKKGRCGGLSGLRYDHRAIKTTPVFTANNSLLFPDTLTRTCLWSMSLCRSGI